MEEICERANLKEALRQVRGNKGSAGCSMNSTASWSDEDTASFGMRTTVTFTFAANARVSG